MQLTMLKSKIHRATLTATQLRYEGSIGIDRCLMEAADILPGEQVHVLNVNNGSRIVTYAIPAPAGSGEIALKGAAARAGQVGDEVIVMSYCALDVETARRFAARVVHVDKENRMDDGKRDS
ncbi:MAG: aspartate 1-decarboxylase [Kiritimatiellae bacterium]|nr:aspartate 1-decarboxylase [Kiritimatiellia bacterium]